MTLKEKNRNRIVIEPWVPPLPSPAAHALLPHQVESVRFALERSACYLALDPGLGKTLCAAMVGSVAFDRLVYVTPPFLVENVKAEFKQFAPWLKIALYKPKRAPAAFEGADVLLLPDSLLTRQGLAGLIAGFGDFTDRTMIIDEAHRYKNKTAGRTKALLGQVRRFDILPGLVDLCARRVYMSGTPMPNRPMELYAVLAKEAPETIGHLSEFGYGVKYCAGYKSRFGWDFGGASNVKELAHRVKAPTGPFMLRLRKSILNLPPKIEEVFILTGKMRAELSDMEAVVKDRYSTADDLIKARLMADAGADDLHVATYRRMLGEEKSLAIIPYIKSLLEETSEKIILWGYHVGAIAHLKRELAAYEPLVVTGQTPMKQRHVAVQAFQRDLSRRLIIGNYTAMGVGFTLTAADREIFIEFDWVPGVNDQASDRAHRIGQTKSILVQYVVYANSGDKSVIEALLRKRKAINLV